MVAPNKPQSAPRFSLGRILATPGALDAMEKAGHSPSEFLARHQSGDWGGLHAEDKQANEDALNHGSRILSAYRLRTGLKIWIITEAADDKGNRVATTILLPDEY